MYRDEITVLPGGVSLLYVDRHLIHDLEAGPDLARLERAGVEVRRDEVALRPRADAPVLGGTHVVRSE